MSHKHIYTFHDSSKIAKCNKCEKPYKERANPNKRVLCQKEVQPPGRLWRRHRCGNWATYKTREEFTCTKHTYLEKGSTAVKIYPKPL